MMGLRQAVAIAATSALGFGALSCREEPRPAPAASALPAPASAPSAPAPASAARASPTPTAAARAPAPSPVSSVARLPGGPAARVVFLDQEHRCPCNARQIDFAWSVIDKVRQGRPSLSVERVHADVDRKREAKLRATRNFFVFPAIYVYDARGQLVALLQGDLTEAEIADALR